MLDDNLDPTPLLKEIRDDKVATIIIDANASVSYLILKKVSSRARVGAAHTCTRTADAETLWDLHFSLSCARLGNQDCSHEGHGELNICKMIKQAAQSPRGRSLARPLAARSLVVATQSGLFQPAPPLREAW